DFIYLFELDLIGKPVPTFPDQALAPRHPDGDHGDDDGGELQHHPQPHQVLRAVGRAALHHVDEAEQQDQRYGADRNGKQNRTEKGGHRCYITSMASFLSSILLPIAVGAVALVLLLGLINMMKGGSPNRSQNLMRLRVMLQFAAIIITMITVWVTGR